LKSQSALPKLETFRGLSHVIIFCRLSKILVFSEYFKCRKEEIAAGETGVSLLKIKTGVVPPLVPEVAFNPLEAPSKSAFVGGFYTEKVIMWPDIANELCVRSGLQ
jgi:hypothetical protein